MKKHNLALCLVFLLFLCSCTAGTGKDPSVNSPSGLYQIDTTYLAEDCAERTIRISCPVLCASEVDAANDTIRACLQEKVGAICGVSGCALEETSTPPEPIDNEESPISLSLEYRITYQREDLLSIVFEGLYNDRTAAHPIHLFFALNIEPQSGETVAFSDRYAIDDVLYDTFVAYAERDITENAGGTWPEGWGTFSDTICDKDSFLNGMRTSLGFSVFFTEEGVGISYPVPYALGDHMEVIIPYDVLT